MPAPEPTYRITNTRQQPVELHGADDVVVLAAGESVEHTGLSRQIEGLARAGLITVAAVERPRPAAGPRPARTAPARKAPARKAPARKAPARKAPAREAAAKRAAASPTPAKRSTRPRGGE